MKRYHEEKHIAETRQKQFFAMYRAYMDATNDAGPNWAKNVGQFRKTHRKGGCNKARCQLCHSEKYPKRIPTRKELQGKKDNYDD